VAAGLVDGFAEARPRSTSTRTQKGLALLNVLTEVEADDAESDLLVPRAATTTGRARVAEFLHNLELDGALGQVAGTVDDDAEGDDFGVAILDPVVGDRTFLSPAPVLAVDGVWEVPFD